MPDLVDAPRPQDAVEQDLLVLTDASSGGRCGLSLPFRDARVVEVTDTEPAAIPGTFDTVVIESESVDSGRLVARCRLAVAMLRPAGAVLLVCEGADRAAGAGDVDAAVVAEWPTGLRWEGLTQLDGRVCAVLRACEEPGDPAVTITGHLATAVAAVRLARPPADAAAAHPALTQHRESRRRSEHALLDHMAQLGAELEAARQRRSPRVVLRSSLERTRAGRRLLVTMRRARSRLPRR